MAATANVATVSDITVPRNGSCTKNAFARRSLRTISTTRSLCAGIRWHGRSTSSSPRHRCYCEAWFLRTSERFTVFWLFQQVTQFAISYFAWRAIGQHLKLFQELDYFGLFIFAEGDEPLTLWPGLARVMIDRFSEGGQVAAVANNGSCSRRPTVCV